jgi:peptidoglycan/xylan/chitin deacetylase (PgdA/CDA1 family)
VNKDRISKQQIQGLASALFAFILLGAGARVAQAQTELPSHPKSQRSQSRSHQRGLADGCVSMGFDDGYENVARIAMPLFKKAAFKGTAYIVTSVVDSEGFMTWSDLNSLARDGWEIGAHSATHPEFEKIPREDAANEAAMSKKVLTEHGFRVRSFAFPFGSYTQDNVADLATMFHNLRGFSLNDGSNSLTETDPDMIQVKEVETSTPVAEVQKWLTQAKKEKLCLDLVFHELTADNEYSGSRHHVRDDPDEIASQYGYTATSKKLSQIIDAVKASGLKVVTDYELTIGTGRKILSAKSAVNQRDFKLVGNGKIDDNRHGRYPNPKKSFALETFNDSARTALISRTVVIDSKVDTYIVEAYFNNTELKNGRSSVTLQELNASGEVLQSKVLDSMEAGDAGTIREPYAPSNTNVKAFRLIIRNDSASLSSGVSYVSSPSVSVIKK